MNAALIVLAAPATVGGGGGTDPNDPLQTGDVGTAGPIGLLLTVVLLIAIAFLVFVLLTSDPFPHDDVHLPRLVLDRDERDPARRLRPLTHQNDAGGAYVPPAGHALQFIGAQQLVLAKPLA